MDRIRSSMNIARNATRDGPNQGSLSVAALLALAKNLLEESFLGLWVEGEVTNYRPAASGHWYFTLKDAAAGTRGAPAAVAELKVAMFRGRNLYAAVAPENGMLVRVRGRLTVYEARGELQLVAEAIEDAGAGAAARAFELLKATLAAEGLFDAGRKRTLPIYPTRIALISSPTGAAVHDFVTVLARRFPLTSVEIWPVLVQGELAAAQMCAALAGIAQLQDRYDVIVLTRGGGSAQDLSCFNNEALVRAVAAAAVPVVVAVGHEIDVTLCDFAADLRAATPTAAAELITPDQVKLRAELKARLQLLRRLIFSVLEPRQQRLDYTRRLLDAHAPQQRLNAALERLLRARAALLRIGTNSQNTARDRLNTLRTRLAAQHPGAQLQSSTVKLATLHTRLVELTSQNIARLQHQLALSGAALAGLSPIRTLERGYVLVRALDGAQASPQTGRVLSSVAQVSRPSQICLSFHDGDLIAHVDASAPD
jgi:exodeoxyribonuclease VII large subunit